MSDCFPTMPDGQAENEIMNSMSEMLGAPAALTFLAGLVRAPHLPK
jgi:hypothetical protein